MKELVLRAVRVDQEGMRAREELFKMFSPRIYNVALKFTGSVQDAEDISSQAFIKAFASLDTLINPQFFGTWLYRIAMNISKNLLKSKTRREVGFDELPEIPVFDAEVEESSALKSALSKLSPLEKQIIILKEYDGKSYDEIASIMKIRVGTVRSRLSRARESLRGAFISAGGGEGR